MKTLLLFFFGFASITTFSQTETETLKWLNAHKKHLYYNESYPGPGEPVFNANLVFDSKKIEVSADGSILFTGSWKEITKVKPSSRGGVEIEFEWPGNKEYDNAKFLLFEILDAKPSALAQVDLVNAIKRLATAKGAKINAPVKESKLFVYAYTQLKGSDASVFTPVFPINVPEQTLTHYAQLSVMELEEELYKYIKRELNKEPVDRPFNTKCCGYWYASQEEAEKSRASYILREKESKKEILYTKPAFKFLYQVKD